MSPHRRSPRPHHDLQQAGSHAGLHPQHPEEANRSWLLVLMAWAHAMLVVPLVNFWEHSVLGPSEELVTSAVHLVCQEAARTVSGVFSWFLALFNNQHRSSLQQRWQYNPWHTWWTQQEQRPNTLNAYLASIDTTSKPQHVRQRYTWSSGQAKHPLAEQQPQQPEQPPVQQQQPAQQAQQQQQQQAELLLPSQKSATPHNYGAAVPARRSSDWTARLGALVAGVLNATPPSPQVQQSSSSDDLVKGQEMHAHVSNGTAQSPAGPDSFGKQRTSSLQHQSSDSTANVPSPLSSRSLEGQQSQASRLLRRGNINGSSMAAKASGAAEHGGRNRRTRSRVSAKNADKVPSNSTLATQRPVVFLQQSGMAVIDAAMARASRTTGLVEDMRLALGLRIAALFDAARQANRWLWGLQPNAPHLSRNLVLHPQRHLSRRENTEHPEPAEFLGRMSRGQPLPGILSTQSMADMSSLRLASGTSPELESDALIRRAVQRTLTEAQNQQSKGHNRRPTGGQPHNIHVQMAHGANGYHGSASGPNTPAHASGYHRLAGPHGASAPHGPALAPSGMPLRRTSSFSTWEEAVAHRREVTAGDVIRQAGFPLELHTVTTEDGYILCMERIPRPGSKDVVFFMHGVLDTSMSWVSAGVTGSQAFAAWELGYDVWLGNSRCNAPRLHQDPNMPATNPAYWRFSVNELGELDITAQLQRIHDTKCLELGVAQQLQQQQQQQPQAGHSHMHDTDAGTQSPTQSRRSSVYGLHSPTMPAAQHGKGSREEACVEAAHGRSATWPAGRLTRAAASDGNLAGMAESSQQRNHNTTPVTTKLQSYREEQPADGYVKVVADNAAAMDGDHTVDHQDQAQPSYTSMHSSSSLPAVLPCRASQEQRDRDADFEGSEDEPAANDNRQYNNSQAASGQFAEDASRGHFTLCVSKSAHARQTAVVTAGLVAAAAQAATMPTTSSTVVRKANSSSALNSLLAGAVPSRSRSANLNEVARHAEHTISSRQSASSVSHAGATGTMSRQTSGGATAGSMTAAAAAAAPDPYRLRAVGHSMGGMSLLIYLVRALQAGKPTHVHRLILLTPAGFHNKLPLVARPVCFVLPKGLWLFRCLTWPWWRRLPLWRPALPLYVPTTTVRSLLFKLLSDVRQMPSLQELLRLAIKLLLSDDASQWDRALQMPHYGAKAMPAVSMDSVLHLTQCANAKRFRMFDYGSGQLNRLMYGVATPPDVAEAYGILGDLPVDLVAGAQDGIIPPHNVRCHYEYMKKAGLKVSYKEFDFGHLDFTFAVKDELKTYLLRQLRK